MGKRFLLPVFIVIALVYCWSAIAQTPAEALAEAKRPFNDISTKLQDNVGEFSGLIKAGIDDPEIRAIVFYLGELNRSITWKVEHLADLTYLAVAVDDELASILIAHTRKKRAEIAVKAIDGHISTLNTFIPSLRDRAIVSAAIDLRTHARTVRDMWATYEEVN